jgi:hypothetical protein
LELRPVFHRTDEACEARLHLGLLAYWLVSTIRFQLKKEGIHSDWRELVRVMNTQKCVTTTMDVVLKTDFQNKSKIDLQSDTS